MSTISLHIPNAAGFLDTNLPQIKAGFARAVNTGEELLGLDKLDIICLANAESAIPETGVGGFTANRNLIYLYIDPEKLVTEDEVYHTLCHEMHHAKRYEGPGFGKTLFDSVVFEGLATCFEREVSSDGSFLSKYLENHGGMEGLTNKVAGHFDDTSFNYFEWFIKDRSPDYPRWTGYIVGYHIISEYLKKTNKKASELVLEDSEVFLEMLRDTPRVSSSED